MSGDVYDAADRHLSGAYTIDRREFMDGDTRTVAKHSYGWERGCRVTEKLWFERGELWIEYYEGDTLRDRQVYRTGLTERAV